MYLYLVIVIRLVKTFAIRARVYGVAMFPVYEIIRDTEPKAISRRQQMRQKWDPYLSLVWVSRSRCSRNFESQEIDFLCVGFTFPFQFNGQLSVFVHLHLFHWYLLFQLYWTGRAKLPKIGQSAHFNSRPSPLPSNCTFPQLFKHI